MSVAEAVRKMIELGASAEVVAAAVEGMVAAASGKVKSPGAERQARYRERNKASQVTQSDASGPAPQDIYTQPPTHSSEANASADAGASPKLESSKDRVWGHVPQLAILAGRSPSSIRSFLGKCLAEFDADIVERAILAALAEGSGDPCAFITRCLKPAGSNGARASPRYSDPNAYDRFDPEAIMRNLKAKQAQSETVQ